MKNNLLRIIRVPRVGIEPTLPKELDFESSASTSSATEAKYTLSKVGHKNTKIIKLPI
jgi:hypothetical protein